MNLKALHRPRQRARAPQLHLTARSPAQREPAGRAQRVRLVGRWSTAADGRLWLTWALEPGRPARRLINRKRGSDA
jgi:hypothetical protein